MGYIYYIATGLLIAKLTELFFLWLFYSFLKGTKPQLSPKNNIYMNLTFWV